MTEGTTRSLGRHYGGGAAKLLSSPPGASGLSGCPKLCTLALLREGEGESSELLELHTAP